MALVANGKQGVAEAARRMGLRQRQVMRLLGA